eukprot:4306883-Amphidinium_carterae.1
MDHANEHSSPKAMDIDVRHSSQPTIGMRPCLAAWEGSSKTHLNGSKGSSVPSINETAPNAEFHIQ